MKFKKVYKIVFTLCGIILSIAGGACIVSGMILQHDQQLRDIDGPQNRVYGTQYWLGLPLIFYGILVIAMGNIRKKTKLIIFNLVMTIPLIILILTGSILHGTSFAHFMSMEKRQLYLTDNGYQCQDTADILDQCLCTNRGSKVAFPISCGNQSKLVTLHGTLFSFGVISLGLLFGILFSSMIFLLQMQLPGNANSAENRGFSNHGEQQVEANPQPRLAPRNQSQENIHTAESPITYEAPPSYDSLVTSFVMTSRITSIGNDPATAFPRRPPDVNHNATVHYRGELDSDNDSFPQVRGLHGQTTLHEITNLTARDEHGQDNSEHGQDNSEHGNEDGEPSAQAEPSVVTEEGTTRGEHGARSRLYTQLEDHLDISPPLLDNENNPQQEITPEDDMNSAENIEQVPLQEERSERHENVPQGLVATRLAPGYNTINNGAEVEQSRFLEPHRGTATVVNATRVSHLPRNNLSSTIDRNSSTSTPQTDYTRAGELLDGTADSTVIDSELFDHSIVDI